MASRNRHDAHKQGQPKHGSRPPWGKLLGGKPIERHTYLFDEKIALDEGFVRQQQHLKMQRLLRHYGIVGHVPRYPVAGVGDTSWLVWYNLALAIASELDDSLHIIDAKPRGKTAPRWRGLEGHLLLCLVNALRESRPSRSVRWCLSRLRTAHPSSWGRMPLKQLLVRYHEAKRYHHSTK
jgi:hypothetical protein